MLGEIFIVVILIIVNAFLAMSELAIVSSRRSRLKALMRAGIPGASRAFDLSNTPGRFLSTVQIGITLVGVFSGAFSGATLGHRLSIILTANGIKPGIAEPVGIGIVVALITYVSLVVGELVPKQIALRYREKIAIRVAPIMLFLCKITNPLVWIFDHSGQVILWFLGQDRSEKELVTDEEIKLLIAEAEYDGTIESDERRMITGVMRLGNRAVRAVMTPRTEIQWLNLDSDEKTIQELLRETQHTRLPAGEGSIDSIIGVIQIRDLLVASLSGAACEPRKYLRKAPIVHDQADALDVLNILKKSDMPMSLIHDEYGHFEGIVTPADILEAITGVFISDLDESQPKENAIKREDGSWLLEGYMPADEMAELLNISLQETRDYETVAGYLLSHLNHLPEAGEMIEIEGWRFEVVDLDGRRIDKVITSKIKAEESENLKS